MTLGQNNALIQDSLWVLDIRLNKEQQHVDKQLNGSKIVYLNWLHHIVTNLYSFLFHDAFENSFL